MWCISGMSGHTATWICSSWACSAWRASGCQCSQQISPPTRPTGVSTTRRPAASPLAQTLRSVWVGVSLRCTLSRQPSSPMVTSELNSEPLCGRARSLMPTTTHTSCSRAAARIGARPSFISSWAPSTGLSASSRWYQCLAWASSQPAMPNTQAG